MADGARMESTTSSKDKPISKSVDTSEAVSVSGNKSRGRKRSECLMQEENAVHRKTSSVQPSASGTISTDPDATMCADITHLIGCGCEFEPYVLEFDDVFVRGSRPIKRLLKMPHETVDHKNRKSVSFGITAQVRNFKKEDNSAVLHPSPSVLVNLRSPGSSDIESDMEDEEEHEVSCAPRRKARAQVRQEDPLDDLPDTDDILNAVVASANQTSASEGDHSDRACSPDSDIEEPVRKRARGVSVVVKKEPFNLEVDETVKPFWNGAMTKSDFFKRIEPRTEDTEDQATQTVDSEPLITSSDDIKLLLLDITDKLAQVQAQVASIYRWANERGIVLTAAARARVEMFNPETFFGPRNQTACQAILHEGREECLGNIDNVEKAGAQLDRLIEAETIGYVAVVKEENPHRMSRAMDTICSQMWKKDVNVNYLKKDDELRDEVSDMMNEKRSKLKKRVASMRRASSVGPSTSSAVDRDDVDEDFSAWPAVDMDYL